MAQKKILLCWPHIKPQPLTDTEGNQLTIDAEETWHGFPLGVGLLGSYLDEHGQNVKCYDFGFHSFDRFKETLAAEMPDILGVTCHTAQRRAVWDILTFMKEIKPECKTVLGGYHATLMWKQILDNYPCVDYCIVGCGFEAMYEFVSGNDPDNIWNLAHRGANGSHVHLRNGRMRTLPLNERPFMRYELFNWQDPEVKPYFYNGEQRLDRLNFHMMTTSRGCYAHCSFCCVSDVFDRFAVKSPERIYEEMVYYHTKYGQPAMWYKFNDETLPLNTKAATKLCNLIINGSHRFRWECYARGDLKNPETLKAFAKAGLSDIPIGVESGSQKILDGMDKGVTIKEIYDTFQFAHNAKINTFALFIVGSVGETQESIDATKELIRDLCPGNIGLSYLTIFPGTKLYRSCIQKGIIDDDYWLSDAYPPLYLHEHPFKQLLAWRNELFETWSKDVASKREKTYYGPDSPLLPEYRKLLGLPDLEPVIEEITSPIVCNRSENEEAPAVLHNEKQLSGYTISSDDENVYATILSLVEVCDEVVVLLNNPTKYVRELVETLASQEKTIKVIVTPLSFFNATEAVLRNTAMAECLGDWILELDSDEVLNEGQYQKIRDCISDKNSRMHTFKCHQLCGDSHHIQFMLHRGFLIDPILEEHPGWGECVINGYTNWGHLMLFTNDTRASYRATKEFKHGYHCALVHKDTMTLDNLQRHEDISYVHYSLAYPRGKIYEKFLTYHLSDTTVPHQSKMEVSVSSLGISERMIEALHLNETVMLPRHFTMNKENPLGNSSDFCVATFHGTHPKYMQGSPLLGSRIETAFDD
ncbi:MAG: radical SAM protein, partial [SAR324 cluster bacterium]|nr:radical SAM protein [SAR324 cluster bacterium]